MEIGTDCAGSSSRAICAFGTRVEVISSRSMKPSSIDPARSRLMSRVKGRDTKPELRVRRAAHALSYRYRLHGRDLPGSPDLVFPGRGKAIFVHGCFWHRHKGCRRATVPKTRREFWMKKFDDNVNRDERALATLRRMGRDVLVVWECETLDETSLKRALVGFLDGSAPRSRSRSGDVIGSTD